MQMVRFNPIREIEAIRNEMDRVFSEFTSPASTALVPPIRVWESPDAFTVQAIIPGLERESLDIQAAPYGIALSGKFGFTLPEGVQVRHSEYGNGEFRRTLQLATQIRSDAVRASYADGILTITLPKLETQRVVKVKLDETATPAAN